MTQGKSFNSGDRIIYDDGYIGILEVKVSSAQWTVKWEDGANAPGPFPESDMVHANGGPSSADRGVSNIKTAALREAADAADCASADEIDFYKIDRAEVGNWLRARADTIEEGTS